MDGNMRGPSPQDCQKSYARTGIPSAHMLAKAAAGQGFSRGSSLVQITVMQKSAAPALHFAN